MRPFNRDLLESQRNAEFIPIPEPKKSMNLACIVLYCSKKYSVEKNETSHQKDEFVLNKGSRP